MGEMRRAIMPLSRSLRRIKMLKFIARGLLAATLSAICFASPTWAKVKTPCNIGDTLVTSGAHAGQCAHVGPVVGVSSTVVVKAKVEASVSATSVTNDSPRVQKIVTRHPFQEVASSVQYRCRMENGAIVHLDNNDSSATGWCHD